MGGTIRLFHALALWLDLLSLGVLPALFRFVHSQGLTHSLRLLGLLIGEGTISAINIVVVVQVQVIPVIGVYAPITVEIVRQVIR